MKNTYILTSDGELAHAVLGLRKARDEHKYMSREWKNGRWHYTYPDDVKKYDKGAKDNTVDTAKASKEYLEELDYNSKKNNYGGSNNTSSTTKVSAGKAAVDTAKVSKEYLEELDYNSTKNNYGSSNNTSSTTKVSAGKAVNDISKSSSEYRAEADYNSQKNEFPSHINQTTDVTQKEDIKTWWNKLVDKAKTVVDSVKDIADEAVDNGKQFIDNIFESYQLDANREKEEYEMAEKNVRMAEDRVRQCIRASVKAQKKLNNARAEYQRAKEPSEKAKLQKNVSKAYNELKDALEQVHKADAGVTAAEQYAVKQFEQYRKAMDHPLRKVDQWLEDLLGTD